MPSDLLQSLGDDFEYIQLGGTAQFSTVHILRSAAGYSIAHQLPAEVSEQLPAESVIVDTMRSVTSLDDRLIGIDRVGTTTQGASFWASEPVSTQIIRTAQSQIDTGTVFGAEETARIGIQLCDILSTLHRRGKTHGGITPAVVVLESESVFLAEAGLESILHAAGLDTTRLPTALQSHRLSPEQLNNKRPDTQSDIYALGLTLYQLITGKMPFGGRTTAMVMASVLTDENAPDTSSGGQEPGHVVKAVLRAIEKDPADRWTDVEHFAAALNEAVAKPQATKAEISRVGCMPLLFMGTGSAVYGAYRLIQ